MGQAPTGRSKVVLLCLGGPAPHSHATLVETPSPRASPLSPLPPLIPTGHAGPHLMISAARLTDMSSTAVEFIRRSWSPGCSFPSAVLPAGNRHVVSHDSTATADLTHTASCSSHPAPLLPQQLRLDGKIKRGRRMWGADASWATTARVHATSPGPSSSPTSCSRTTEKSLLCMSSPSSRPTTRSLDNRLPGVQQKGSQGLTKPQEDCGLALPFTCLQPRKGLRLAATAQHSLSEGSAPSGLHPSG